MKWETIIPTLGVMSAIIIGWISLIKQTKKDVKCETKDETQISVTLQADMEYLKRGIDDIRYEVRSQGQKIDSVVERLTRVEESEKSAHKRLDALEKKIDRT